MYGQDDEVVSRGTGGWGTLKGQSADIPNNPLILVEVYFLLLSDHLHGAFPKEKAAKGIFITTTSASTQRGACVKSGIIRPGSC
jgi:hypothetical protein